jgi:serine/threonine protein kinase
MSVNLSSPALSYGVNEPLPAALVAEITSRYILEREIGRGGAAIVWSAIRRADGRPVAIKLLRPVLAQAVGAQRFLREIRIASAVTSSALVPLEEAGEVDGLPYYVMPLAEGGSLRDRLKSERSLHIAEAVAITRTIAQALAALHAAGFVHRDIKPENVLLGKHGEARLADYGIAHAITAAAKDDLTSTGVVLGTPPYMSPEQAGGGPLDGRSDVYSLGCLLYEMLAGEPPFHGANPQAVLARHMHEAPPSLRVVRSAVPDALEALTMQMLAKVPADRFDNGNEVIAALDALGTAGDLYRDCPPSAAHLEASRINRGSNFVSLRRWRRNLLVAPSPRDARSRSRDRISVCSTEWVKRPIRLASSHAGRECAGSHRHHEVARRVFASYGSRATQCPSAGDGSGECTRAARAGAVLHRWRGRPNRRLECRPASSARREHRASS